MPSVLKWKKHKALFGIYKSKCLTLIGRFMEKMTFILDFDGWDVHHGNSMCKSIEVKKGRKKKEGNKKRKVIIK